MTDYEVLWEGPKPDTWYGNQLLRETYCGVEILVLAPPGSDVEHWAIVFDRVGSYKHTVESSIGPKLRNEARNAWNQIIRIYGSPWLQEVSEASSAYYKPLEHVRAAPEMKHLAIAFQEEAYYEFICTGFRIVERPRSRKYMDQLQSEWEEWEEGRVREIAKWPTE